VEDLPVRVGLYPHEVESTVSGTPEVIPAGARLLSPHVIAEARSATLGAIAGYHRNSPLEPGLSRELARQTVRDPELADLVQQQLAHEGLVVIEGQTLRLADHRPELTGDQRETGERVLLELERADRQGKTAAELEAVVPDRGAAELVEYYVRLGTAVRVGKERYYSKESLDRLLQEFLKEVERLGEASPGQLRDLSGLSRKFLIPLLEWMDVNSYTVRRGDNRALGPAAKRVLGSVDTG
ncbi:MAG: SelB C-terminal domain-containing protein, partial [Gemmatimonadota bacterium]